MRRWPSVLLVVFATLASTFTVFASPAAAAPAWKIVASPNPPSPPTGAFSAVDCTSSTNCFGVGSRDGLTLIERWNGTAWSVLQSPNAVGGSSSLVDVSCPTATDCWAVGRATVNGVDQPMVERWNGLAWLLLRTPDLPGPPGRYFTGISCPGASNCFVVGTGGLIVHCCAQWSVVSSPGFPGDFTSVSCASATNCLAVGTYLFDSGTFEGGAVQSFSARWNGSVWSQESVDEPPSDPLGTLQNFTLVDISCASATHCFAVGEYDLPGVEDSYRTLTEQWNGVQWSTITSPNAPDFGNSALSGVSCATSTGCTAVGRRFNSSGIAHTLTESWNGSSWSVLTSPNAAARSSVLSDVVCTSATGCFAVGAALPPSSSAKTLIEQRNDATWSIVPSPNGAGAILATLNGVACTSATNCFAVGLGPGSAPIERWNGTTWSIVANPTSRPLNGIACPSATSCFAVGDGPGQPSIQRWNGTQWSVVPSPAPAGDTSRLASVSCSSPTSCFAVGEVTTGSTSKTLVERWNGSAWSIVPSPNRGSDSNTLTGISCTSPTSCLAVGSFYSFPSGTLTLSERWNGSSWTVVASPNRAGSSISTLEGIACVTASNCYAVGAGTTSGGTTSFVLHWNGTTWAGLASAHPGDASSTTLSGVSCSSATSCAAVGSYVNVTNGVTKTFVVRWNGLGWQNDPSPNQAVERSSFAAVSCVAGPSCFAVGSYYNGVQTRTLTERYA
jgi:hypothetical protein